MAFQFKCLDEYAKQNLNLSELAFYIMSCDYSAFTNDRCFNDKIPSGFLNRIFQNYYADVEDFLKLNPSVHSEKGVHFNFRLQKKTQDILLSDEKAGKMSKYYFKGSSSKSGTPSVGKYLKAVFEEYARQPYFEREKIYFKEEYIKVKTAIELKNIISFKYRDKEYKLAPYEVTLDEWSSYNYVVGFTGENELRDFRLSYMEDIEISYCKGNFTETQRKKAKKELIDKGVQFLNSECKTIKVVFTAKGKKNYDHWVFLRPQYITQEQLDDGYYRYTFKCTEQQAEYYFFKFGADAIIEEPISLRKQFEDKYKLAISKYV